MKSIISLTYFDVTFDNRVKRTIHIVPEGWQKIILYNAGADFGYHQQDVTFINANGKNKNAYIRFLLIQWFMLKTLFKYRPEIVICNDIQPAPVAIIYKLFVWGHTTLVYDAHEMETMLYPQHYRIMSFLEWLMVKVSTYSTTINQSISDYMSKKYSGDIKIIANYPSVTEISEMDVDNFLRQYNLNPDDKLILYTGIMLPHERGVEEVIQAIPLLPGHYKFLISGVGDLTVFKEYVNQLCELYSADKSRVVFIGPYKENDLISVVSFCHISILLYNYRLNKNNDINTPNKLYQAYLAGTHMLMCDNTSFKKIMSDSTINIGKLTDPHDISQIAEQIKAIIEDPEFADQKKQIKLFGSKFLWESEFEKLRNIIFS